SWRFTFASNPNPVTTYNFNVRMGEAGKQMDGLIGYFIGADYDQMRSHRGAFNFWIMRTEPRQRSLTGKLGIRRWGQFLNHITDQAAGGSIVNRHNGLLNRI
ncbi:MAG: hypothetical protein ABI876_15985, partial [Bacteroidota bacterium]